MGSRDQSNPWMKDLLNYKIRMFLDRCSRYEPRATQNKCFVIEILAFKICDIIPAALSSGQVTVLGSNMVHNRSQEIETPDTWQ